MMSGYQPQGQASVQPPRGGSSAKRASALADLAERLAEVAGAAHLVANVLGTAAVAAGELAEADTPLPERPAEIPVRYSVALDAGAFVIAPVRGEPLAYAETQAAAERIAIALNLLAAIEENSDAAAQG